MKSTDEQWSELWNNEIHIDNRVYLNSKFSLYALHMFFVEVELLKTDEIIMKIEFKTGALLDRYSWDLN